MTASHPCTARQLEVLHFIAGYLEAHNGVSPTYREIASAMGFASKSGVGRTIDCLQKHGYLRVLSNRHRAIQLMIAVAIPRAPDGAPLHFITPALIGFQPDRREPSKGPQ